MNELNIKPKDFTILETYNKPWYNSDKDKKYKLGVLHKATLKK